MEILWTRVDGKVVKVVEKLARMRGISISEYIRHAIIKDLEDRKLFDESDLVTAAIHQKNLVKEAAPPGAD